MKGVGEGAVSVKAEKRENASETGDPADPFPKRNHVTLQPVGYH